MNARSETVKQWQEHIQRAQAHEKGVAAYCREAGLKEHRLYYWRNKFDRLQAEKTISVSSFIPVEVSESGSSQLGPGFSSTNLPDPKWLGEFLRSLLEVKDTAPMRGQS